VEKILIIPAIILLFIISAAVFLIVKTSQVNSGREEVDRILGMTAYPEFVNGGSIRKLSILPLVDFYSDSNSIKVEPGVSYLIKADNKTILLDTGYNSEGTHPSALLQNMKVLNINISDIDMIFITHLHPDHLGGMDEMKHGEFSLSRGTVELGRIPVYSPGPVKPSRWNPGPEVHVIHDPTIIAPGIFSLGVIPRHLFLMGRTDEQVLALNLKGKGIVLIVGCGHPTVERIIQRAKMVFHEPIYAIIGGLHFPVHGGRGNIGPVNIQYIVGADRAPWHGLTEQDVNNSIRAIEKEKVSVVSLSPHDSSDWSLEQFRKAFPKSWIDLKAGKEINL